MKRNYLYLTVLFAPAVAIAEGSIGSITYAARVDASEISWTGYKITGQHSGSVDLRDGNLIFEDETLVGGEFTIDMTTIRDVDMAGSSGATKLEGHLKSDDFFGVEKYPTAHFVITDAVPYGTTGDYKVSGDLTIKGVTKPIKFMANVAEDGGMRTATASITIDRSEFNVRYGSGSFFDNLGDKVISDNFDLNITLSLIEA